MGTVKTDKPNNAKRLADILAEPSEKISLNDFKAKLEKLKKIKKSVKNTLHSKN